MAIDVLSDPGSAPIIVGDAADMTDLKGVFNDAEGRYFLRMTNREMTLHDVALSPPACENFGMAKHLLLVDVSGVAVSRARRVAMNNLDQGQELTDDQCRALAEALSLDAGRKFRNLKLIEFRSNYPELTAA